MRRWLVPAILALVCLTSGTLAVQGAVAGGPAGPARPDTGTALATPVLSVRRVPGVLSRTIGEVRLVAGLEAALAEPSLGPARERSCLVVRSADRVLFERRPDQPLIPASTMKVLTGLAALRRLGPDARYVTEVKAAAPAAGGVVDGPLWLVGGGDPLLATADYAASFRNQPQLYTPLEELADRVVAAGVREVRGGVVGDESRYDTVRYVPTWKPGYLTDSEVGPASALVVNDNFTQFRPRKMLAAGAPAVHAAAVLTGLLQARGVVVAGPADQGTAPAQAATVASLPSPPVADVVGQMLRESDNLTAELLVKELGRRDGGGGSWAAGLAETREALAEAGLPVDGFAAADGSGLDRSDQLTCGLLMAAMTTAGSGPLVAGLPVAGQTGTLARRFLDTPVAGRLRAKTGSLDGVAGLVGYATSAEGGDLLFSLLANDLPRDSAGFGLQERVGQVLVAYPDAPPPSELAPLKAPG